MPVLVRLTEEADAQAGPCCRLVCGILHTVNTEADDASAADSMSAACKPGQAPEGSVRHAIVSLPEVPLDSLSAAAEPADQQQLPSLELLLPCSQIWRTREPPCGLHSPGSGAPAAVTLAAGSGGSGAASAAPWAVFTWASGRPVSRPPEQAPAAWHLAAGLDTSMPAAAETPATAEGVHALQLQQQPPAGYLQEQQPQREAEFMDAASGETEAWAAANGGIWAVHTLRDLTMCPACALPQHLMLLSGLAMLLPQTLCCCIQPSHARPGVCRVMFACLTVSLMPHAALGRRTTRSCRCRCQTWSCMRWPGGAAMPSCGAASAMSTPSRVWPVSGWL